MSESEATTISPAERVNGLLRECLFRQDEIPEDGTRPEGAVIVEGLVSTFGFHPGRLSAAEPQVRALIDSIVPDEFIRDRGGGWTFLNLCTDRKGEQWAEHPTMEALVVLAIACGLAGYSMPRDVWSVLPGGVPYVWFDTREGRGSP